MLVRALVLPVLLGAALIALSDSPSIASESPRGDVNCSGASDTRDALDMLLVLAEMDVALPEDCLPIGATTVAGVGGDVNCDGEFDLLDLLTSLKLDIGLPVHPCFSLNILGFGAVGAAIGPKGGTLTTTSLNGTSFTLDIPEGALLGPEQIRMTPVDEISNLPVPGGLVGAVDLQPSGLQFWLPVILTIDPPAEIQPADQTPFVISGGEFVLHPLVLESEAIKLPLTHFSAAGLARGPMNTLPPNSDPLHAYTAALASLVQPQREALLGGGAGDPQFVAKLAELIDGYYEAYVAPALEIPPAQIAGLGACPVPLQIIAQGLGLSSQGAVLGGGNTQVMNRLERIGPMLAGCREREVLLCITNHDLGAISRIVAYSHVMALLGIDLDPSPLELMMHTCAQFEVKFRGWFCTDDMSTNCSHGISYSFLTDWIPFEVPLEQTDILGFGPLEKADGSWHKHNECEGQMLSQGSTFQVIYGGIDLNSFTSRRPKDEAPIQLGINPGKPEEHLHLDCSFGSDDQEDTLWWRKWCSFHQAQIRPPVSDPTSYCITGDADIQHAFDIPRAGWHQEADDLWRLNIKRTYKQAGLNEIGFEDTEIRLRHRPVP